MELYSGIIIWKQNIFFMQGYKMFKRIQTLFIARNKEFFRDKSALGWNILFPFLIIIGFSVMFSENGQPSYKAGLIVHENSLNKTDNLNEFKNKKYIQIIKFSSFETASIRLKHHSIDFIIDPLKNRYCISNTSPNGKIVEDLFKSSICKNKSKYIKKSIKGNEVPYIEWLFPGIIGMNMMFSALFGVGYTVIRYRKNFVLKRLSASPLKPFEFLSAQIISRIFLISTTTIVVYIGCFLIFDFRCHGSYLSLILVFFLGGFSMISMGLIVASRSSSEEFANGVLNLITWPMMFLSEVWFSLEGAKPWVKKISLLFPLTHMIAGTRKIMNDGATLFEIKNHVITLFIMSVLLLSIGSYLFKWNKE